MSKALRHLKRTKGRLRDWFEYYDGGSTEANLEVGRAWKCLARACELLAENVAIERDGDDGS